MRVALTTRISASIRSCLSVIEVSARKMARSAPCLTSVSRDAPRMERPVANHPIASNTEVFPDPFKPRRTVNPDGSSSTRDSSKQRKSRSQRLETATGFEPAGSTVPGVRKPGPALAGTDIRRARELVLWLASWHRRSRAPPRLPPPRQHPRSDSWG